MSNHISHNFQQLREIHPWTSFQMLFQNTPVVLSHDAMMYIYDYLVPMHVDLNAPICIFYEHKDRDTWETTTRSFTIDRFDFIYQLMKGMWYKHIFHNNTEKIKPYHTGKPNPIVTKYIERYFHEDTFDPNNDVDNKGDIIFVGDTLETDIKLAKEAFFKSILVLSGNTKKENLKKSHITPDITLDSVDDLSTVIGSI